VLGAAGVSAETGRLQAAAEAASFGAWAAQEIVHGFIEAPRADRPFFRRGEADGWRRELDPGLAEAVERDHGTVMHRLGYPTGGAA